MSGLENGNGSSHERKGAQRMKRSIRVDFTPLVDLGFLLITFFMLTTSMIKPRSMEIQKAKPVPDDQANQVKDSQALSLYLTKDHKILFAFGRDGFTKANTDNLTSFKPGGIRKLLLKAERERNPKVDSIQLWKKQVKSKRISASIYERDRERIEKEYSDKALFVIIKADDRSRYEDLIKILDEMSITNIRSYAIVDISPSEKEKLGSLVP